MCTTASGNLEETTTSYVRDNTIRSVKLSPTAARVLLRNLHVQGVIGILIFLLRYSPSNLDVVSGLF